MIKRYIYNKPQQFLGVLLFAFYFSQLASDNIWQLLVVLQRIDLYKQLSGFMILLYVAGQWRLAYLRLSTGASRAAKHLVVHKWLGVLAPILLCLHTVEKGYAYQTLLLVLFIVISITGLLNFYDVKLKKDRKSVV